MCIVRSVKSSQFEAARMCVCVCPFLVGARCRWRFDHKFWKTGQESVPFACTHYPFTTDGMARDRKMKMMRTR